MLWIVLLAVSFAAGWFSTTGAKSQFVRLGDVFVFGPFLIWASTRTDNDIAKIGLILFGASTMAYNARNWLHESELI